MNVREMFGSMGIVGLTVMVCLVSLSVYSVAVTLDKLRRFRTASRQSEEFLATFRRALREGKLQEVMNSARQNGRSPIARVVGAGLTELADPGHADDPGGRVEMVTNALECSTALTVADLRRGLAGLATIGSTAPFVGLFGTVVGIVHSFRAMAATGSGGMTVVSGGIAEALVATALGLLVAIPAVVAFNYFAARWSGSTSRSRPPRGSSWITARSGCGWPMPRVADRANIRPTINVTPLVDVVLVLLIIFMVIAPSLNEQPVDLPQTDRPLVRQDDGRKIEVILGAGGTVWIDGQATTADHFAERILDVAQGRLDWPVLVKGDATLTFGEVQRAMLAIEAAGFPGVGLLTEPRDGASGRES